MEETVPAPRIVRFGIFEADPQAGELRRNGLKVKLSGQPFQILAMLLERSGEVVTREQLQQKLWPGVRSSISTTASTRQSTRFAKLWAIQRKTHVSLRRWLAGVIGSSHQWKEWDPNSQPT